MHLSFARLARANKHKCVAFFRSLRVCFVLSSLVTCILRAKAQKETSKAVLRLWVSRPINAAEKGTNCWRFGTPGAASSSSWQRQRGQGTGHEEKQKPHTKNRSFHVFLHALSQWNWTPSSPKSLLVLLLLFFLGNLMLAVSFQLWESQQIYVYIRMYLYRTKGCGSAFTSLLNQHSCYCIWSLKCVGLCHENRSFEES